MLPQLIKSDADLSKHLKQPHRGLGGFAMSIFNVVTRSDICREFDCHRDTVKRWIKEEGFPEPLACPAREPVFKLSEVNRWIEGKFKQESGDD